MTKHRQTLQRRVRAQALALGHHVQLTMTWRGRGYAECTNPGCNMGFTIDKGAAHGAAAVFECPARQQGLAFHAVA